jgi:uncharacterized cupin superfamily protein
VAFENPDEPFEQVGINIRVLEPGDTASRYHSETAQEDFLVLQGTCTLVVAGEERKLKQWDFFHCPPGTEHVFIGAGDGPCVVLMVGARRDDLEYWYPEYKTASPAEAYAGLPQWKELERAPVW